MWLYERKACSIGAIGLLLFGPAPSPGQTIQPMPATHTERALSGIKVSWYSGLDKKMVMMRVENTSGKNINAYNISFGLRYADGSTDYKDGHFSSEHLEMFPVVPVNGIEPQSFAAGMMSRDQPIYQGDKEVAELVAVPDVIVYTDDTAEVRNERAFKQIMASRKGALLALQQVSEIIKRVLADGAANPAEAAMEELTRLELALRRKHSPPEEVENNEEQSLQGQMGQLENAEQMAKQMRMSEHNYLTKMAEDFDKQIALMAPHCEIKRIE
jgi:hypothetical protein